MPSLRRRTFGPGSTGLESTFQALSAEPLRERLAEVLHDLHTPLTALSLLALPEGVEGNVEDESRRQLRRAVTALRRQTQVLRDHPLFRTQAISLARSRCALADWLEESRAPLEELAQARGMSLEWRLPNENLVVEIDMPRLATAIEHLFLHRSRRSKRPGILVFEVSFSEGWFDLRISGVDSEVVDPLSPVDRDSAGVEFAIAVIEAHGGRIQEEPASEGRRDWVVSLPRHCVGPSIVDSDSTVEQDAVLRVMVVEDDAALRELLCDLLSIRYPVVAYQDASDAMQGLSEGIPDLMVVDHGLPDGTGLELASRIREIAQREIPLLLVTGSTAAEEFDILPNMHVLPKPFRGTELLSRSVELLRGDSRAS